MAETVDIQKVIRSSTSQVSLEDLTRKGFKQVRVLNHATISRLIAEAVDKVIAERSKKVTAEEREKLISASHQHFKHLARNMMQKDQEKVAQLQASNKALKDEVTVLESRLKAYVEVQAERDQSVGQLREKEQETKQLQNRLVHQEGELQEVRNKLNARDAEVQQLRQQVASGAGNSEEVEQMREKLIACAQESAKLQGQLTAKSEEIERLSRATDLIAEKVLGQVSQRLGDMSQMQTEGDMSHIKNALAGLSDKLAKIAAGGVAVGKGGEIMDDKALIAMAERIGDEVAVEFNKVEVKQAKSAGVKGSLAKLRMMQKGAKDDGE